MSVQSKQNEAARILKELATLQKQDADEAKKEVARAKSMDQTSRSLQSTRSEKNKGNKGVRAEMFLKLGKKGVGSS